MQQSRDYTGDSSQKYRTQLPNESRRMSHLQYSEKDSEATNPPTTVVSTKSSSNYAEIIVNRR